jgi:hypothetical protein
MSSMAMAGGAGRCSECLDEFFVFVVVASCGTPRYSPEGFVGCNHWPLMYCICNSIPELYLDLVCIAVSVVVSLSHCHALGGVLPCAKGLPVATSPLIIQRTNGCGLVKNKDGRVTGHWVFEFLLRACPMGQGELTPSLPPW